MVELTKEHDLETLRQISLLLDRENQRLITKTLELTAEGRAAYPVQKEAGAKVVGRRLKSLTLAEARQLYTLLTRLAQDRDGDGFPSACTAPNPAA